MVMMYLKVPVFKTDSLIIVAYKYVRSPSSSSWPATRRLRESIDQMLASSSLSTSLPVRLSHFPVALFSSQSWRVKFPGFDCRLMFESPNALHVDESVYVVMMAVLGKGK